MSKPTDDTFEVTHIEFSFSLEGEWEETGRKWVSTYRRKPEGDGIEVVSLAQVPHPGADPIDLTARMHELALANGAAR